MKTRYSFILFLLLAINSYTALLSQQLPSLTDSRDSRLCIAKLKMRDGMFYGYLLWHKGAAPAISVCHKRR